MKRCMFLYDGMCTVLTVQKCEGCKFAKTESEFVNAQAAAEKTLERKGLKRIMIGKGRDAIVTTEKVVVHDNG